MKHYGTYLQKIQSAALAAVMVFGMALSVVPHAAAATLPTTPAVSAPFTSGAKVSFTFDDGLASAHDLAAPVLAAYNYPGTDYVITGCIGMTTAPNTCAANPDATYMTWPQVSELQNSYGWEVGSHTVTHPQLSTDRISTPAKLTKDQMIAEIVNSKAALAANAGVNASDFADPYGDYDNLSVSYIAKTYASHRGFADIDYNAYPYNDYLLTVEQIQGDVGGANIAKAKAYIDQAKAQGKWLIMVFHDIKADSDPTYDASLAAYQYKVSDLTALVDYVHSLGLPVTDISHGLVNSGVNMLSNGNFNSGLTGWTTDNTIGIKPDTADNGSYDGTANGSTNSISLSGSAADTHLFSPNVVVSPTQSYVIKNFVNVTSTSGEISFYVDEYDANGVDLKSGKFYTGVTGTTVATTLAVKNVNIAYTPSPTAASIRLQVIVHGAATKAYLDNVQMFPTSAIGAAVPVTPPVGKTGDVNGDNAVDALDLSTILSNWGKPGMTKAQGDLNADNAVDALDLSTVLSNWGK